MGATTNYEAELWAMADALRGSMDAAKYEHDVIGLIFLQYSSDGLEKRSVRERKALTAALRCTGYS